MEENKCKRCGRKLTNPISVARGYGSVCQSIIINFNTPNKSNFESFQKDLDFLKLEI